MAQTNKVYLTLPPTQKKLNNILKPIRQIFIFSLITAGVFFCMIYSSCNKNKCGGTTCQNSGTCTGNVCVCPQGYSGISCQTGWSDAFVGTYLCKRSSCNPGIMDTSAWQSVITKATTNGGFTINISNFNHSNVTEAAYIDSFSNLTISPAAGGTGIHASGNYSSGKITLTFTTYSSGGSSYTCNMTMVKQ